VSLIKNINLKLDEFELSIPELEIADSGVTAVQGESGSGKTTLLNVLVGLHKPAGWQWNFKGTDLAKLDISERRLGVVFQTYDLFPHMTAQENVQIVLEARFKNLEDRQIQIAKLEEAVKLLRLEKCWNTKAENLSGGEKQRTALLRAVFSNPRMLILDEPFAALDINLRHESRMIVKDYIANIDVPVLMVTHDSQDVTALAQNILHLQNGKIRSSN
jgi:sulfate transport system ATP-binding protein/putative spermidine/putrescine transport system ATP-binding protein